MINYVASIPGVHISMYLSGESLFIVEYHNNIIKFQEFHDGLYYYDTANKSTSHITSYYYYFTVKYKKGYFSTY